MARPRRAEPPTVTSGARRVRPAPERRSEARPNVQCVLRCRLYGSEKCGKCPIPDRRGAPRCPRCGGKLYFITVEGERARWACNGLKACGQGVSLPIGDPDAEAAQRAAEEEDRRWLAAKRRRERRQKKRARSPAGVPGSSVR